MLTSLTDWQALQSHYDGIFNTHAGGIVQDANRTSHLSVSACDITLDYSKNRINSETMSLLF